MTGDDRGGRARAIAVVGRDLRAPRAAGVAGLLFAVLFVGSLLLLRGQPDAGSSADEIAALVPRERLPSASASSASTSRRSPASRSCGSSP